MNIRGAQWALIGRFLAAKAHASASLGSLRRALASHDDDREGDRDEADQTGIDEERCVARSERRRAHARLFERVRKALGRQIHEERVQHADCPPRLSATGCGLDDAAGLRGEDLPG